MPYDPNIHHRRSIRLKGYDYDQPGAYFVTMCTFQRECLFGKINAGEMMLNQFGEIVFDEWFKTAQIRPNVNLHKDEFMVIPNHIHGIIWIIETDVERPGGSPLPNMDQNPIRLEHLWGNSNLFLRNASTKLAIHLATTFGNAIITNTSSETTGNSMPSANTSSTIQ